MTTSTSGESPTVYLDVELKLPVARIRMKIPAPAGPVTVRQLLPVLHSLTNRFVEKGIEVVVASGDRISCKKGCGACCRQLVPVVEAEARQLLALVESFEEPRRSEVLERFAVARRTLEAAGFMQKIASRETSRPTSGRPWGSSTSRSGSRARSWRTSPAPSIRSVRCPAASTSSRRRPRTARGRLPTP